MKNSDLSKGNVKALVMRTAVPMVIAQIVSMLYNIVDRIFVGQIPEIGATALGGVGVYLPVNILFMAFSLLIGAGGAPQAAIAMGAGDIRKAEKYLGCCILPLLVSGSLFAAGMFIWGEHIMPLFGATAENLIYAVEYVRIISLGIPFSMLVTGLNMFINTQGKTVLGMVSVLIGALINIILDAFFIVGMDMGVTGAALATVIGQVVSALWVVGYLFSKKSAIRIRKKDLIPNTTMLWNIVTLGAANFITTGAESLINILLNYSLKKYGPQALSGYGMDGATLAISVGTIVTTTSSFIRQPINGFGQGLQPVISYNYGAGFHDRVKEAIRFSIFVTTIYAALLWLFLMASPGSFSRMFTQSKEVVQASEPLIRIYILGMIFSGIQSVLMQSFVSRGLKKQSLLISLACKTLYIPLLLLFPVLVSPKFRMIAIYGAQAITDLASVMLAIILYRRADV